LNRGKLGWGTEGRSFELMKCSRRFGGDKWRVVFRPP